MRVDGSRDRRAPPQVQANGNWLILDYASTPQIRLDARILDRVLANDNELALEVYDISAVFTIGGSAAVVRATAEKLVPHTRSAPITTVEAYEYAKRRLETLHRGQLDWEPEALFFGDELVWSRDEVLYIGQFACLLSEVERYGTLGGALPLPNGLLPAALPLLVVADKFRKEYIPELSRRIEEYEARPENAAGEMVRPSP